MLATWTCYARPGGLLSPPGRAAGACYRRFELGFWRFLSGGHLSTARWLVALSTRPGSSAEHRPAFAVASGPDGVGIVTTTEGAERRPVGAMNRFAKVASSDQDLKWAHIWFSQLARFHRKTSVTGWKFSADDVIAFLRQKRDTGVPAWKRMEVIEGLIDYRRRVRKAGYDDLKPLREKMAEIIVVERVRAAEGGRIGEAATRIDPNEPDVLQAFRRAVRATGLALQTERTYVKKIRQFMEACKLRCLADFDGVDHRHVKGFLSDMAVDGNVSASTQNVAFHALLKLWALVLKRPLGQIDAIRAVKDRPVPAVLAAEEVAKLLSQLSGVHRTIAKLLYGCGLRISEAMRLRVKDIDFAGGWIDVQRSKGGKSRRVPMPECVAEELRRWIDSRTVLHRHDVEEGIASV